MNTTKLPKENDVGLDKAHVIGRFFYTDIFKNDIIVVTKTDGKGYYGFSIKDGKWNGNTNSADMQECELEEVRSFIEKQSEQLICPSCSSENVYVGFSHYNICHDCNYHWVK